LGIVNIIICNQEEILKMYVKYIPTDKLVVGNPANNFPAILADEKNTGLKAKINRKNPNSDLFRNINAVSKKY